MKFLLLEDFREFYNEWEDTNLNIREYCKTNDLDDSQYIVIGKMQCIGHLLLFKWKRLLKVILNMYLYFYGLKKRNSLCYQRNLKLGLYTLRI